MNPLTETTGSNEEWLQNSPHSRGIILRSAQPARQCAGVSRAVNGAALSLLRREAPRSYVEDLFLVLQSMFRHIGCATETRRSFSIPHADLMLYVIPV
jgi:hypothetical protein